MYKKKKIIRGFETKQYKKNELKVGGGGFKTRRIVFIIDETLLNKLEIVDWP